MREIKFNAVADDDYVRFDEWKECNYLNGLSDNEILAKFLNEHHGYEPLQYTGLKDKNGVEIYYGQKFRAFDDIAYRRVSTVTFHNGAFGYYPNDDDSWGFVSFAGNTNFEWVDGKSEHIEVISCVHQDSNEEG